MIIYCLSYAHDIMIWITRSSDLHSDNIITATTTATATATTIWLYSIVSEIQRFAGQKSALFCRFYRPPSRLKPLQRSFLGSLGVKVNWQVVSWNFVKMLQCVQPQYIFIHLALLEEIVLGNVSFPCYQFEAEFFQLCHPLATSDVNGLQLQYDVSWRLHFSNMD